jgi:hypothetical protein
MENMKVLAASLRTEGIKVQIAINSGGSVAMLGFMQSLVAKTPEFSHFKLFGVVAMFTFAIGAAAGAEALHARSRVADYVASSKNVSKKQARRFQWLGRATTIIGKSAFFAGIVIAGIGICYSL